MRLFLPLLLALALSGCLTLKQQFQFQKNGSGTAEYVIELGSSLGTLLSSQTEEGGEDPIAELSFEEEAARLRGLAGISKIEVIEDREDYRFGVRFAFDGIASLNEALSRLLEAESSEAFPFFRQQGNVFFHNTLPVAEALDFSELAEGADPASIERMLSSVKIQNRYSFAQPVKVVYSAGKAEIQGKKGRGLLVESTLKELSSGQPGETAIVLKK